MRVINHVQGTPEWLAWRNGGIGSSDAMVIAAAHGMVERKPWMKDIDDLFREKVTGVSETIENDRMKRGKDGEAAARAAFEHETGMIVSPVCGEMDAIAELKASFDGLSFDGDAYVEIKCPHESVHELAKQGEIVDYYKPQVAHQGIVAWGEPKQWPDHGLIYFASFVPETGDLAVVYLPAAKLKSFAQELYAHELDFLQCLRTGTPPCGDAYMALAVRYQAIEARLKELTTVKEQLRDSMIKLATEKGVTAIDGGGVTLSEKEKTGSIDYAKLCAEYSIAPAEQERYRKKGTKFWQVRVDAKLRPADAESLATELLEHQATQGNLEEVTDGLADPFWSQFSDASNDASQPHQAAA